MRHRPGITLVEVLAAIFIMGIGLLALLVLFPVGALSMARGVRDDRAAAAGANAASLAIAFNVRNDPTAVGVNANNVPNYSNYPATSSASVGSTLYVDPYYSALGQQRVGTSQRPAPCQRQLRQQHARRPTRYFSFQDEIVFGNTGAPDSRYGSINRPCTYTWAYLLRHYSASSRQHDEFLQCGYGIVGRRLRRAVAAGSRRRTVLFRTRQSYLGSDAAIISLTMTYTAGNKPNIRKSDWVLDVSTTYGPANGYFYRVDSVTDTSSTQMTLQLETPLKQMSPVWSACRTSSRSSTAGSHGSHDALICSPLPLGERGRG